MYIGNYQLCGPSISYGLGTSSTSILSTDKKALVHTMNKTGTITYVSIPINATSTGTWRVRLETVNSSSIPTGILYNVNAQATFVPSTNGRMVINFPVGIPVVQGDKIAIVIEFDSGATTTISFYTCGNSLLLTHPACLIYSSSAWAKTGSLGFLSILMGYSDGSFQRPVIPTNTITAIVSGIGTSNEVGIAFQVPAPCRLIAVKIGVVFMHSNRNYTVSLYDDSGATIFTSLYPSYSMASSTGAVQFAMLEYPIATPGKTYILGITESNTLSFATEIYGTGASSAAEREEIHGNMWLVARPIGGTWVHDLTSSISASIEVQEIYPIPLNKISTGGAL
jgi:hypothetical protein